MSIVLKVKTLAASLIQKGAVKNEQEAIAAVFKQYPEMYGSYRHQVLSGTAVDGLPGEEHAAVPQERPQTVKQLCEAGVMEYAQQIYAREGGTMGDAIGKAIATPQGRILYEATRTPAYAQAPASSLNQRSPGPVVPPSIAQPTEKSQPGKVVPLRRAALREAAQNLSRALVGERSTVAKQLIRQLDELSDLPPAA
jgi:hypothetical protein